MGSREQSSPSPHPLGPLLIRTRSEQRREVRRVALILLLCGISILKVARWLHPDPRGWGTHEQLGKYFFITPCLMPALTGYPCPTCGMTTAFAYTVRGRWISAFHAQPFGFGLALFTILMTVRSIHALITGWTWRLNIYRIPPFRIALWIGLLFLAAWGYKAGMVYLAQHP